MKERKKLQKVLVILLSMAMVMSSLVVVSAEEINGANTVTVEFTDNNKTVTREVTLPCEFKCAEDDNGTLDQVIQELYADKCANAWISCINATAAINSDNSGVTVGKDNVTFTTVTADDTNYPCLNISNIFKGTFKISGKYFVYPTEGSTQHDEINYNISVKLSGLPIEVNSVSILKSGEPVSKTKLEPNCAQELQASVVCDNPADCKVIWSIEQDDVGIIELYTTPECTEAVTEDPVSPGYIYMVARKPGNAKVILTSADDPTKSATYEIHVPVTDYRVTFTSVNGDSLTKAYDELPHTLVTNDNGDGELDQIIQELYGLQYGGYFSLAFVQDNQNFPVFDDSAVTKGKDNISGKVEGDTIVVTINDVFEGTYSVKDFYYDEKTLTGHKFANNSKRLGFDVTIVGPETDGGEGDDQPGGGDGDVKPGEGDGTVSDNTVSGDTIKIKHEIIKVGNFNLDIAYPESTEYLGKKNVPSVSINGAKPGEEISVSGNKTGIVFSKLKVKNDLKTKKGKFTIALKAAKGVKDKDFKKSIKEAGKALKSKPIEYTIIPRDLSNAKVEGSATYTSKSKKWKFKLTVDVPGGKPMKLKYNAKAEKSDFTVDPNYDGKAKTVKITGTGLYKGTKDVTVTVK